MVARTHIRALFKKNRMYVVVCALIVGSFVLQWMFVNYAPDRPAPYVRTDVPTQGSGATTSELVRPQASSTVVYQYIEVRGGCGPYFEGPCINVRSGPGLQYPVVLRVRDGMVLRVADTIDIDGELWYKIAFDREIRYPERVTSDWYVSARVVRLFTDDGDQVLSGPVDVVGKRILVVRSEQMLYAYDNKTLFMKVRISSGLEFTPTPRGRFVIFKKTPSRYMQGPIPEVSDQYFDLPGVPWNLYFTQQGAVIHGAYWHDHFGEPWSHGCVNLDPADAQKLYEWADIGTPVVVQD